MTTEQPAIELDATRTKLKIVLPTNTGELSADEITNVIRFLCLMREKMRPAFGENFAESNKEHVFVADRYEVAAHPLSGTAQVHLRVPGLGWATTEMFQPDVANLVAILQSAQGAQRNDSTH